MAGCSQKAITWANADPDLYRQMILLSQNNNYMDHFAR